MIVFLLSHICTFLATVALMSILFATAKESAREEEEFDRPDHENDQPGINDEEFVDRCVVDAQSKLRHLTHMTHQQKNFGICGTSTKLIELYKKTKSDHSRYLIALRHFSNLSQKEMAKELKMRSLMISSWENGRQIPTYAAKRISKRYSVPLKRLMTVNEKLKSR